MAYPEEGKYDVFISFRGEDTRAGFVSHLYKALNEKKIRTFFNDDEETIDEISEQLLKAIEESKVSIVVFSSNYASSRWCLDELVHILECNKSTGQMVIPVFYHVDPSEVATQTGTFADSFAKHSRVFNRDLRIVQKWKHALSETVNLSGAGGWDLNQRPESKVIAEVVEHISKILDPHFFRTVKDLVGMASRVRKLFSCLDIGLNDVRIVGILGKGGIGKTTLVTYVFNRIFNQFDSSCFLANVGDESTKHGLLCSQAKLFKTLLKTETFIQDLDVEINLLRCKLSSKKVLVVLDDVCKLDQLEALAGKAGDVCDSFAPGSRIIITSTDRQLLSLYGAHNIFEVESLTDDESLQLFCQKAFNQYRPKDDYVELSRSISKFAGGLPLALNVLGSSLHARERDVWLNALRHLDEISKDIELHRMLRVSYDALCPNEKEIFLDIACFFKGEDVSRVNMILESCNFFPTVGIHVLIDKSLISIQEGKILMHDLIRDLGQKIVCQESLKEPGKRSRLWSYEDACHVLQKNKGTRKVKGLFLCSPGKEEEQVHLNRDPFSVMENLRFLKIRNVKVWGCLKYNIPKSLRLLEWHKYPLRSIPSSFKPNKLVELSMPGSRIERLWRTPRLLNELRLLNLSDCQYLKRTPDFTMMPSLERLILEGCKRLSEVHPSLGALQHLVSLNMKGCECLERLPQKFKLRSLKTFILSGCSNLKNFPEIVDNMEKLSELHLEGTNIQELPLSLKCCSGLVCLDLRNCKSLYSSLNNVLGNLTSLKVLNLSGCSNIDQFPENLGNLEQLEQFFISGTVIRRVPSSILYLKKLKLLSFRGCRGLQLPASFSGLCSLTTLDLSQCNLQQGAIPNDIDSLSSLEYLDLSENEFSTIPEKISLISKLRVLDLSKCSNLQSLPKLPLTLRYVIAYDCPMLRGVSSVDLTIMSWKEVFHIIDCRKSLSPSEYCRMHERILLLGEYTDIFFPKFIEELIWDERQFQICLPYTRIPDWCNNWCMGSSIIVMKMSTTDDQYTRKGFFLFLVILIKEHDHFDEDQELIRISCYFQTSDGQFEHFLSFQNFQHLGDGSYGIFCYVPCLQLNLASRITGASFSINRPNLELKMSGLHLVFEQEVENFSKQLSQTANEHRNVVSHFSRHCEQLLDGATKLGGTDDGRKIGYDGRKIGSDALERQIIAKETPYEAEHQCSTWLMGPSVNQCLRTDSTVQKTRELWSLLSRLFQGCSVRTCTYHFVIPLMVLSPFFFHHCLGNVAVCYVPPSLYDDEKWVGLELYVLFTRRPAGSSEVPTVIVDLYGHGISAVPILTYPFVENDLFGSVFVVCHVPRECFPEQLNQCKGISALFRPITSGVEIQMCGTRLLYEQNSESLVEAIIECTWRIPDVVLFLHRQVEVNIKAAEEFLQKVDFGDQNALRQEMPHSGPYSFHERELIESLQKLFTSTLLQKYRSYLQEQGDKEFDPMLLHSERHFMENMEHVEEIPGEGGSRNLIYDFNHVHIMAETLLCSGNPGNWKRNLQFLLTEFFNNSVVVTLSLKGHMVSMSKQFNPCSTYNMCFPRKEMLQWLDHQSSTSMVEIKLPTNLYDDNDWRGLVICASFAVHEHSTTADVSFKLLCHLTSNGCCLNPISLYSDTKDEFKWSYIRGFIWITYLPRAMLEELKGQTNVEARIYSSCPYLTVRKCGIRLLYQEDAEDFKEELIHCWTSFFDNLAPISRFIADKREKDTSC